MADLHSTNILLLVLIGEDSISVIDSLYKAVSTVSYLMLQLCVMHHVVTLSWSSNTVS